MKLTSLISLIVVATAAPQQSKQDDNSVLDERSDSGDGNFFYNFEVSNGIAAQMSGPPGAKGWSNFRFRLPDASSLRSAIIHKRATTDPILPRSLRRLRELCRVFEHVRVTEEPHHLGVTFEK